MTADTAAGSRGSTRQPDTRPLSVSELTRQTRVLLEERFHLVWVAGEVSNFRRPGSGHWYFTLKDAQAQIRCAMFAGRNRLVRFPIREGDAITVRGRVTLFEPRGDCQIIVDHMEPYGEGALRAAFEALKRKLAAEGLFDESRKRPLPDVPGRAVVITSPSGAAIHDVLTVVGRRFPAMEIVVLPVAVQGETSEPQIVRALSRAGEFDPDVVLLTRGGGSLEDLWSFNAESVARAIVACACPVVVAVGHETDVTIADFAADQRAPTPSAGAELITPDSQTFRHRLGTARARHVRLVNRRLEEASRRLIAARVRLVHPSRALLTRAQHLDMLTERLRLAGARRVEQAGSRVDQARRSLSLLQPGRLINRRRTELDHICGALRDAMFRRLEDRRRQVAATARALNGVSPLNTLARGYAIVTRMPEPGGAFGSPVQSIEHTRPGDRVRAHVADGHIDATVEHVSAGSFSPPPADSDAG